jgi:hypothetical protein
MPQKREPLDYIRRNRKVNMEAKCEHCRYWGEHRCRLNPPVLHPTIDFRMGGGEVGYWPTTEADDWCGQFKPKTGDD